MNTEYKLKIAVGKTRLDNQWVNKEVEWSRICKRLSQCKHTEETVEEYKAMSRDDKGKCKDHGGFVGGALIADGPRQNRTIAGRSLVTLDIDFAQGDTLGVIEDNLAGTAWCLYSTHSHTPESPRLRLVVPLSRGVTPDEYDPIARRVASWIGMDLFDDSTYEAARLMYWPSAPKDGEFIYQCEEGKPLSVEETLRSYVDWRNIDEWPVSSRVTKLQKNNGKKQENPLLKKGAVGAFCRAYTISEAISEFLPDIYKPTGEGRYTYVPGSTSNGVVTYEDKWAYSHHGTDPAGNKLCNAFDLVRIHLFGNLDEKTNEDTPANRMPSFTAMSTFVSEDPTSGLELKRSFLEDFTKKDEKSEKKNTPPKTSEPADTDWVALIQTAPGNSGKWLSNAYNFKLICENDPGLKDTVRHDAFADRNLLTRDLPWRKKTSERATWDDNDDNGLVAYIAENYKGLTGKQAIVDAHDLVMSQSSFHPVREYLDSLDEWDGVPRLDTLFIDRLGASDNELTRMMTRKQFVAAVARVMKPGCKFDYILTLIGPEGIGKSFILGKLFMGWFDDSFSSGDIGDKTAMEQVKNRWGIELGEMKDYKRNSVEAMKAFLSKQADEYRPAYGRKVVTVPRQCVFFATTNEENFLKGDTGNRRFWTIRCYDDMPINSPFEMKQKDVDDIWAEAYYYYKQGEPLYLSGKLEAMARARQDSFNELDVDDRIGLIESYLRTPIPENWYTMAKGQRVDYFRTNSTPDMGEGYRRRYICAQEVLIECFRGDNGKRYASNDAFQLLKRIEGLKFLGPRKSKDPVYGNQRRYEITEEFWEMGGTTDKKSQ